MQRRDNKVFLRGFKNYYCDGVSCALGEFLNTLDYELKFTDEELDLLLSYAVVKNIMAGVSELYIKTPRYGFGLKALDKFGVMGKEILPCEEINSLETKALVGDRLIIEVASLIEYTQSFLSEVANFVGLSDFEVLIRLGQDLEEVGKVVNLYKLSPAQTLESFGFLDRKCYVLGLNFIDKDDQKLLKDYEATCIFQPLEDGERGLGTINLYNFIYNQLKLGFSSGKCYNIDMIMQGKIAKINTSNLMYQNDLIDNDLLLESLMSDSGEIELDFDDLAKEENLFDKKVSIPHEEYLSLRERVKALAKEIKENKR